MLEMIDRGEIDHKIICTCASDETFRDVDDIEEVAEATRVDIVSFFSRYKPPSAKGVVEVGRFLDRTSAIEFVQSCSAEYKRKFFGMGQSTS